MSLKKTVGVIINNPSRAVDRIFTYTADESVKTGDFVRVPFGKGNKLSDGLVVSENEQENREGLKEVACKGEMIVDEKRLSLLIWLRDKYLCSYYDALRVILPPGIMKKGKASFTGRNDKVKKFAVYTEKEGDDIGKAIEKMRLRAPSQARALEVLSQVKRCAVTDLEQIASTTRSAINALVKKGFAKEEDVKIERDPLKEIKIEKTTPYSATKEQKTAIDYITNSVKADRFEEILLRGVTGSGKTEVYLQAVEYTLNTGKSAVILVPEISLTPQMSKRFASRFKDNVAILHSGLSAGERYDEWEKIRNGRARVVVGARSAIFAPVSELGLVVIDEEHENSYKSDMTPKYDAREVARELCQMFNAVLLSASATPSVKSGYRAVKGEIKLLQIKNRYNNIPLPEAEIADLRYELVRGNKSFIGQRLRDEIEKNLKNREQTILFLNRRGYSTFVSCRSCGYVVKCPVCDVAMTYHKYNETLMCHYCGYTIKNITVCPQCRSKYIKRFGIGTQKVQEEIEEMFPSAKVLRMDVDSVSGKMGHYKILEKFKSEKADILVGTQMIAKGLDFPNVTLVGVIAADMMLYVDDYSAQERTFQLITQVLGRAGRGIKPGRAIIQTYSPDHFVLKCAKDQDYRAFFANEIKYRQKTGYPPFCDIISIIASGEDEKKVKEKIINVCSVLKSTFDSLGIHSTIIGPSPSPVPRINNRFRWRILIKCIETVQIRKILREKVLSLADKDIVIGADINPGSIL